MANIYTGNGLKIGHGTFTALNVAFPVCLTFLMDSHYRSPVLSLELQV